MKMSQTQKDSGDFYPKWQYNQKKSAETITCLIDNETGEKMCNDNISSLMLQILIIVTSENFWQPRKKKIYG